MRLFSTHIWSDNLPFSFKPGLGCSHAIFALRTVCSYFNKRGSNVHIASLDASKAFDKVDHSKLFSLLMAKKVPFCFINIMIAWYGSNVWLFIFGLSWFCVAKILCAVNALNAHCKYVSESIKLHLFESYCLPILLFGLDQIYELNVCWNNAYRKIFGYKFHESVKLLMYFMLRLDFRTLFDLRCLLFINKLSQLQHEITT